MLDESESNVSFFCLFAEENITRLMLGVNLGNTGILADFLLPYYYYHIENHDDLMTIYILCYEYGSLNISG